MNASLSSILNSVAKLGVAKPTAAELSLLILLGASLLALRAFRENYLKVWVVGWLALVGSRLADHAFAAKIPAPFDQVAVQASFMLAVGVLAGAVLVYTRNRDLIVPLTVITPVLVGFAGARVLLWPDSLPLRVGVEVGYRLILLTASIALLRARRGRFEPSAWLLALCLPTLHLAWSPFTDRVPVAAFVAAEIALGISMLLVVFDQARTRNKRLAVVQVLTGNIVSAQQYGNMVQSAVEELQRLTKVRAAWFRLLEGGQLVATHAVGVSADFLRDAGFAEVTEDLSKLMEKPEPRVTTRDEAGPEISLCLENEKIRQIVMLPVVGKKAPIGLLLLGNSGSRGWTTEELDFLQTCALQLAIAVENFRLLEQVLRSQRQWMNTFDSIHDIILAHDSDFRIVKANQVLLEHLGQAPADVIGVRAKPCCPTSLESGRVARTARWGRTKNLPRARTRALAASRWFRLLPIPSKAIRNKALFTWCATLPTAAPPRKNTACCSSKCKRASTWLHRPARSSIATMPSCTCWATVPGKSCWC